MIASQRAARPALIGSVAVALAVVVGAACGNDSSGASDTASTAPSDPPSTVDPAASAATTSSAPAPEAEPLPTETVPDEPVSTRDGLTLTASWPYTTSSFDPAFAFQVPDDDLLGRWRVLFDTSTYLVLTFNQQSEAEPSVQREEPGVVFYSVPESQTADDFIAGWEAFGGDQQAFTVERSDGEFLGAPAVILSGTYDIATPTTGALFARLGDDMRVPTAPGERSYLTYLVDTGEQTLAVMLNAHELDEALNITLVNQIVSSIEFE